MPIATAIAGPTKRRRAPLLVALLLPGLLCAVPLAAQNKDRSEPTLNSRGSAEAPVGHRQPRAADIPADVPKDALAERIDQINRKLDRLQICRRC